MSENTYVAISDKLDSLPQDLFSVKSLYLMYIPEQAKTDPESAVVRLGRAGERLAKGLLQFYSVEFSDGVSFDFLIKELQRCKCPIPIVIGLRTVLKYRNQAAHDSDTMLSVHDVEAAVSAFCAAYHEAYNIVVLEEDSSTVMPVGMGVSEYVKNRTKDIASYSGKQNSFWQKINALPISLFCYASAVILFWAVIRGGDYSFFLILRIVVTATFILVALKSWIRKRYIILIPAGLLAVLFNPLIPIYMSRELWVVIDAIVLGVLVLFGILMRNRKLKR
jgi:hypothetical protein